MGKEKRMQIPRLLRGYLLTLLLLVITTSAFAGVAISVTIGPPALPVYTQPPCPGDGYIWTPGYWAYGPGGYYWVPGTWVQPPTIGVLWTPGYWGWHEGVYVWHAGYWGPHIGFYGGVNYGHGYFGNGYEGGYWRDRHFYYNRTVNNVTVNNVHVYNKTVINNVTVNRVSYNDGPGGIHARPTREQEAWGRERHYEATHMQMQHEHSAGGNRAFLASENHGRPPVGATSRPGEFHGHGAAEPRSAGTPYRHSEERPMLHQANGGHDGERPMVGPASHSNRADHAEYNPARGEGQPRGNANHQEKMQGKQAGPQHEGESHNNNGHHERPR
jgi:hypothetical protein